jgi:dihydrofolate reductase
MTKLRVRTFSISLDGYGAGPNRDLANPLGVGAMALHQWFFETKTFVRAHGRDGGQTGVDDDFAARGFDNVCAWIIGHVRSLSRPMARRCLEGWWGANPPFRTPVFVLTNHPRPSIAMERGTVFHFVADGIHAALKRASAAAGGKDIRLGGGVATIRQYLQAKLIDEMLLAWRPCCLARERTFLPASTCRNWATG